MASNSTISVTFKVKGDASALKDIAKDSEGLKKVLESTIEEADKLPKKLDFKKVATSLAKVTAALGTVGAAVGKVASDAINLTQKWGDEWQQTTFGAKSAYQLFIRQLSSGEGWDNLFSNMERAYTRGREIAASLDEIFERSQSYNLTSAEGERYISEQQLIMRDSSRSDEERKQAAQNIINKEKELGALKQSIAVQEARAKRDNFQLQTGLNDEETDFLVKNYETNRQLLSQAREYLTVQQQIARSRALSATGGFISSGRSGIASELDSEMQALNDHTSQVVKKAAEFLKKYDRSNDELVEGMVQAEVAVISAETEANRASLRATATLGTLSKSASASFGRISDDVASLMDRVRSAVEVNNIFGAGWNSLGVQLSTMKSGIEQLIGKYGAESEAVKALIRDYKDLLAAKTGVGSLEPVKAPQMPENRAYEGTGVPSTASVPKLAGMEGAETAAKAVETISSSTDGLRDTTTAIEAMAGAFGSLGQMVSDSTDSWASWIANLLRAVAQAVPALATLSAAHKAKATAAAGSAIAEGAASAAATPVVGPALAVAAASTILASITSAISSIPKFAAGGIAYGPTLGMFGEYSGASHNPEVVAPLDKLRSILFGGSSAGKAQPVEFRIKGRDLVASYKLETSILSR